MTFKQSPLYSEAEKRADPSFAETVCLTKTLRNRFRTTSLGDRQRRRRRRFRSRISGLKVGGVRCRDPPFPGLAAGRDLQLARGRRRRVVRHSGKLQRPRCQLTPVPDRSAAPGPPRPAGGRTRSVPERGGSP